MKLETEYHLLYTNGCSHTNHMPQPDFHKWPHHLKNILEIRNVYNNAEGASSNFGIFRRTSDFLSKTQIDKSKILAVIQLTYANRYELPRGNGHGWQSYLLNGEYPEESSVCVDYHESWIRLLADNPIFELWYYYNQASAISNVLRAHNVDHYFVTMDDTASRFHEPGHLMSQVDLSGIPIDFDQNSIKWLFGGNTTESSLVRIMETSDIHPGLRNMSDDDTHYSDASNEYIATRMALQIERFDNIKHFNNR